MHTTIRLILGLSLLALLTCLFQTASVERAGAQIPRIPPTPKPTPRAVSPTPRPKPKPASTPTPMPKQPPTSKRPLILNPTSIRSFEFETISLDTNGKQVERRKLQARYFTEDLGYGVTLEMVEIPGGSFQMGSSLFEVLSDSVEVPQHTVNVSSFWMGKFEITLAQWVAVMEKDPSHFKSGNLPVEDISWNDAQKFLKKLNARPNLQGKAYRLPTEAEWEYAARAGTTTPFAFGETITPEIVNYNGDYPYAGAAKGVNRQNRVQVGSFGFANAFGLYDMHGNVWEWCEDVWHDNYQGAPTDGSAWLSGGDSSRVLRGGSWYDIGLNCRSAHRDHYHADLDYGNRGVRVVVGVRTP